MSQKNEVLQNNIKCEEFYIKEYEILIENLNKISDDLLKIKWYFLASLGALGLSYQYILSKILYTINEKDFIAFLIVIIGILGNIIFWLINEYILSHGFIFRFIQAKAANKENLFFELFGYENTLDSRIDIYIKDPSDESKFFKDVNGTKKLCIYHKIPDQFVPIYWASVWAIVLNTIISIGLLKKYQCDEILYYILSIFFAVAFIYKIMRFYLFKIQQFIGSYCEFEIRYKIWNNEKDFYKFFNFNNKNPLLTIRYSLFYSIFFIFYGILAHLYKFNIEIPDERLPIIIPGGINPDNGKKIMVNACTSRCCQRIIWAIRLIDTIV
jgi:hypothetical protein